MPGAVEQVIHTANLVVAGRLSPREAVTIFSPLIADAVAAARSLRDTEPAQADAYRELILQIGRALRRSEETSAERRHLRAVTDDLARVLRALDRPDPGPSSPAT